MNDKSVCQCSELERQGFGVKKGIFGDSCKKCNLPIVPEEVDYVQPEDKTYYSLTDNSIEEQESLINALIQQMAIGGKYKKALTEGKFASFSLTGTNDWEDYASSVFRVIMLKELMRISKSVDKLTHEIERLNNGND